MTLADTNLGNMVVTKVEAPTPGVPKVEGLTTDPSAPEPQKEAPQAPPKPPLKSFDLLAKKEKQVLAERQRLAAERQAIAEQVKQLEEWRAQRQREEEESKTYVTNPEKLLAKYGWDYNKLAEFKLNDNEPTPQMLIKQQQDRINELEARWQNEKKQEQEAAQKAQNEYLTQVVADFKDQIDVFVTSKPDTYEYIKINEGQNLVYQTVEEYYNKTGQIMPIKKACDLVEQYLSNIVEDKLLKSKKLQQKIGYRVPTTSESPSPKSPRTLSNTITTTSAPPPGMSPRNEADRMARAMAKLEGR